MSPQRRGTCVAKKDDDEKATYSKYYQLITKKRVNDSFWVSYILYHYIPYLCVYMVGNNKFSDHEVTGSFGREKIPMNIFLNQFSVQLFLYRYLKIGKIAHQRGEFYFLETGHIGYRIRYPIPKKENVKLI
jgi:hypothetical protein